MIFYSGLVINKELWRAKLLSEILTNLLKQKLDITKLNKSTNTCNSLDNLEPIFRKGYFRSKISLCAKFHLEQTNLNFWNNFPRRGISVLKQKKWTSPSDSVYLNHTRCQISAYKNRFDFSGPNLPNRGISSHQKKLTSPSNSAYSN